MWLYSSFLHHEDSMTTIRELSKYAKNACERSTLESGEKSALSPQVP